MAIVQGSTFITMTAAGDTVPGKLKVLAIAIAGGSGGATVLKDGNGDPFLTITTAANGVITLPFGFGWWVEGIEFDTVPASSILTIFLA